MIHFLIKNSIKFLVKDIQTPNKYVDVKSEVIKEICIESIETESITLKTSA